MNTSPSATIDTSKPKKPTKSLPGQMHVCHHALLDSAGNLRPRFKKLYNGFPKRRKGIALQPLNGQFQTHDGTRYMVQFGTAYRKTPKPATKWERRAQRKREASLAS